jgi:hypothetical protein
MSYAPVQPQPGMEELPAGDFALSFLRVNARFKSANNMMCLQLTYQASKSTPTQK